MLEIAKQDVILLEVWRIGPLQKDGKATLNPPGGDRDDATLSDTNPTIDQMSHILTASTPMTNLTFKAILRELISSVIYIRKTFHLKPQNTPKTPSQPSPSGVSQTVMPMVTAVVSTSLPQTMSQPAPSATSSGSTSLLTNPGRCPPETRHQAAVSQDARFKANRPVTSQAVVQLLDMLDKVTEELQCEESMEEASSMEKVHENCQRISGVPND